jgi:hypothetical protein
MAVSDPPSLITSSHSTNTFGDDIFSNTLIAFLLCYIRHL